MMNFMATSLFDCYRAMRRENVSPCYTTHWCDVAGSVPADNQLRQRLSCPPEHRR